MSTLNTVAVIVCVCCISCSIISLLIPLGRMTKIVNLVMGLFLITNMIIPMLSIFSGFKTSLDLQSTYKNDNLYTQQDYDELVLNQTADNLVQVANELLKSENITPENIEVSIKKTDNNRIYISAINIYINKDFKNRISYIKKIIFTNMSKEPVVIVNE